MASVFVSYSHQDEEFRDELEVHLAMLKRQGLIDVWHDRRITAGKAIDPEISSHLESASLVLLLVSPYFLDSDYCYETEMTRALERHYAGEAQVIPIILNPCEWRKAPFGGLRASPPDGKPVTKFANYHDAYLAIATDIREALEELGVTPPADTAPQPPQQARAAPTAERARSSNLRVKREFSEHEKDVFIDGAFEYLTNFFEASLEELRNRNREIETRYRRIDANCFSAAVYRRGQKQAACKVWISQGRSRGIHYSSDDDIEEKSYNELVGATDDGQMMLLMPTMGIDGLTGTHRPLNYEGLGEYLWAMFIGPLQ